MRQGSKFYETLYAYHEQLLAGDPTLLATVARLTLEPLIRQVTAQFPGVDDHAIQEGVADALLEYGARPFQARATTGAGVMGFLVLRAGSRMKNVLRKDRRQQDAEIAYMTDLHSEGGGNTVELATSPVEYPSKAGRLLGVAEHGDAHAGVTDEQEQRVAQVLGDARTETDRRILELMLNGVRQTPTYAKILGIEGQPLEEQRRIVKRHKDRLKLASTRRQEAKDVPPKPRGRPRRSDGDARG